MIVECISDFGGAGTLAGAAALMHQKIVHPAGAMRNPQVPKHACRTP